MKTTGSRRTLHLFEPITTMLKEEWERKKKLNPIFVCSDRNGQIWLGHSTMLTTANMYAHLDTSLVDECGDGIKKI